MTDDKRRRLIQAGLAAQVLGWSGARAQTPERNLGVTERKPAAIVAAATSLLVAPRRALVIGNSSYSFAPLTNPANDAKAIGEQLKRTGFEVVAGLDLPRKEMIEAIRAYAEHLTKDKAVGLFYFAGHGLQLAWRNYLVPVDAKIGKLDDIQASCVDVNTVIEGISKAANPMNVVILDACRENPFPGVKLEGKGLSQLDAPQATLLAYATAPGNLASDGEGANGLYTEHLLREMKVPEAKIEDVFKRVRLAVRRKSNGQQLPWESTSLEDDFWFIPPPALQKLANAEAYKAELERRRKQEQSDRAYEEELAFWNKARTSTVPGPIEEYLKRYPSGRFAEIAQAQLDRMLAQQGEKKVEVVSSAQNPYSQGSATASTKWAVGDSYTYQVMDLYSKVVERSYTQTITSITDTEVIYGDGNFITDLIGNTIWGQRAGRVSPNQYAPLDFSVGKRWSTRFKVLIEGNEFDHNVDLRITRRERVTVPAGAFEAFCCEASGSIAGRAMYNYERKIWFAPGRCRRPIAIDEVRRNLVGRLVRAERQELVTFNQA